MVPTNSTLNDLITDYFNTLYERDGGNNTYGPIVVARNLVNLNESGMIVFPYPEKTIHHTIFFDGIGPISAGTVTVETSHDENFAGNWHILINRTFSGQTDSTLQRFVTFTGPYLCLRSRVTSSIIGGTVDVYFTGVAIDY